MICPFIWRFSLHACDTATDDALASAVAWQADVILAVPCCQHELASLMPKDCLPLLSGHGILHERFAALATDALRAKLLSCVGYETQVMEFIDMEHTAKNLLIRAVRRPEMAANSNRQQIDQQMADFLDQLGVHFPAATAKAHRIRHPGRSMKRTLITICTYNEVENIRLLIPELRTVCSGGRRSCYRRQFA